MAMRDGESWHYAILNATGVFIGNCSIITEGKNDGSFHVTIALIPDSIKGRGTAAVTELIKLAKKHAAVKSLFALVEDGNAASKGLMKKFDEHPASEMVEKFNSDEQVMQWRYRFY